MDERVAEHKDNTEAVIAQIPEQHRGAMFERVLEAFHPQENTRRLELAFALIWAQRNSEMGGNLLTHVLHGATISGEEPGPHASFLPQNKREWDVACMVAATVVQWLPTSAGCSFMAEAFRKAGGTLNWELPDISGHEQPRR